MLSPAPYSRPAAVVSTLTDEEEATLSEAMEGYDSLEELLDQLLDSGDKDWNARFRPTGRPLPQPGK